jgi:hypothetical protein
MTTHNWPLLAKLLAVVAHKRLDHVHRAAFCIDGNEENLVIAIFGNDDYSANSRTQHEVDSFRLEMNETANLELGFGLSPDGGTWVLLLRPDLARSQTLPAKVFQLEMLKSRLDDIVCAPPGAEASSQAEAAHRSVSEYHPAR